MTLFSRGLVLLCLALPTLAHAEELELMVPGVASRGGVDTDVIEPIDELLLARLNEIGHYKVLGASDIRDMLEVEQQKMLLGCDDDSCLAELAGALGINLVAQGSVGKLGDTYLFSLKVINTRTAAVEARCTREVPRDLDAVLPAVSECINDVTGVLGPIYDFEPSTLTISRPDEAPLSRLPFFVAAGTAVGAGIATVALDLAAGNQAAALRDNPGDDDAYKTGKSLQTIERVTLGVTVAATIAAGVLAMFTDFNPEEPDPSEMDIRVGAAVAPAGATLMIGGEF